MSRSVSIVTRLGLQGVVTSDITTEANFGGGKVKGKSKVMGSFGGGWNPLPSRKKCNGNKNKRDERLARMTEEERAADAKSRAEQSKKDKEAHRLRKTTGVIKSWKSKKANKKKRRQSSKAIKKERKDSQDGNKQTRAEWYNEVYLKSDLWRTIRSRVLKRDQHRCLGCGNPTGMVHHASYLKKVLDGMDDDFLISICDTCHNHLHFDKDGKKRSTFKKVQELMPDRFSVMKT